MVRVSCIRAHSLVLCVTVVIAANAGTRVSVVKIMSYETGNLGPLL